MTYPEQIAQIENEIARAESRGEAWTNQSIYAVVGGQRQRLATYLRDRRAQATALAGESPAPVIGATFIPEASEDNEDAAPVPGAVAPPPDPVALAEQALAAAEQTLSEAREDLLQAKIGLMATQRLAVDGILHGSLMAGDEIHQLALHDVDQMKQLYDEAWRARDTALLAVEQALKAHRRGAQERWVHAHKPELVAQLDHWGERLRAAASDWAHAQAKKEHAAALFAYTTAVAQAPWSTNGTPPS